MADPTVFEATMVQRVLTYAAAQGVDRAELLAATGYTEAEVVDPDRLHPIDRVTRLFRAAAAALRDPALGLHVAASMRARDYGLIGLVFDHQPDLDHGLDALARVYSAFLAGASIEVIREEGRTRVISGFDYDHEGLDLIRQEVLAAIYVNCRRASETPWTPLAVRYRQVPADPAPFRELYGVDVVFGSDEDELVLDPAQLARPLPNADPVILAHLMEAAEVHLVRRRAAGQQAARLLHLHGCTIDLNGGVVQRGTETSYLTTKERDLIEYFAARRNDVVTHDEIERDVWRIGRSVVSHAPAVAIRRLRQKIEPPKGRPINLITVFGEGWKLVVNEPADGGARAG
ncbi:MAG TPA: AraC family transcriptional regulator ligand-binding domain-containing protein [Myxococcota bacterium]|nr:AraC family transcriptional regulator ligand-binding domain-containing protein [Myxococcota bacterium]